MSNKIKAVGIFGALAVILGAFGAHGLKPRLSPDELATFQTGVQYHFYHVLAMGILLALENHFSAGRIHKAFLFFAVGIILFSGSLYAMTFGYVAGINLRMLGMITPLGGLSFIIGWVLFIFDFGKTNK